MEVHDDQVPLLIKDLLNGEIQWGDIRGIQRIMDDDSYDYSVLGEFDPTDIYQDFLHLLSQCRKKEFKAPFQNGPHVQKWLDILASVVLGSNRIENGGTGKSMTELICKNVFYAQDDDDLNEKSTIHLGLQCDLRECGKPHDNEAVIRGYREIAQHAKAACYIIGHLSIFGNHLSEEVILETHRILTNQIDTEDGLPWDQYSGMYRQCPVKAGFHQFIDHKMVPRAMRKLVESYMDDIKKVTASGKLDPVAMAAKYCHMFVNIHPFVDGNGRICRVILNAVLMKYCGVLVPIGLNEAEINKYMTIVSNSSYLQSAEEDAYDDGDDLKPQHHKSLASFVLLQAREMTREMISCWTGEWYISRLTWHENGIS